jgi:tetratricopeptide (TPR) repeat protein
LTIYEEFKHITGFELFPRQTNCFSDRIKRKDSLFSQLAILYFSDRAKFNKIRLKIKNWLRQERIETIYALAGYIYYICEDFKKAKRYFLKTISLNPNNLDNWIDLAFSLRHLGEYVVSNGIIFNYNYVIYYYKYLKLIGHDYSKLKKLIFEILGRTQNV